MTFSIKQSFPISATIEQAQDHDAFGLHLERDRDPAFKANDTQARPVNRHAILTPYRHAILTPSVA